MVEYTDEELLEIHKQKKWDNLSLSQLERLNAIQKLSRGIESMILMTLMKHTLMHTRRKHLNLKYLLLEKAKL